MRIGIDARSINNTLCGVGRASQNLIKALAQNDTENEYVLYVNTAKKTPVVNQGNFREQPVDLSRYSLNEHRHFHKIIARDELDIFHSLHATLPFRLPIPAKVVITVHDIIAAKFPWFFSSHGVIMKHFITKYFREIIRSSVNRADMIVSSSEFTKKDIIETFAIPEKKIKTIYLGLTVDEFAPLSPSKKAEAFLYLKNKYHIEQPFILYVGNFRRYKNIEGVLAGYAAYLKNNPHSDVLLVIGGNDKKNLPSVKAFAQKLAIIDKIRFVNYINEEELPLFYATAQLFVFPSLYEGFGFPPLEAMASGTPVLSSHATSLPEIVGNAGMLTDPLNADEIGEKIALLLTDETLRKKLIPLGLERAKMFSWDSSAKSLLKIYQSI